MSEFDREIERYTRRRMRELRGETALMADHLDPFIQEYTRKRIREMRLQHELQEREVNLDNVLLGGYTVATLEAYDGKS